LLRWFWWRINAWSEISAMASSFLIAFGFFVAKKAGYAIADPAPLLITVAVTTVVWVTVTMLTEPADRASLVRFYELTRPAGPGWNAIRAESNLPPSSDSFPQMLLGWTAGVTFVYAGLFGTGSLIYGRTIHTFVWVVVFVVSGVVLWQVVKQTWASQPELAGSETSSRAARRPCTKAVVLARGVGSRMREPDETATLSAAQAAAANDGAKAMLPLPVGRPFLDYVLSGLADAGFTDVCIVVAPQHAEMRDRYTRAAIPTRLRIQFAVQLKPVGTADAVLATEEFVAGEPFVVVNADNYYPTDVLSRLRTAPSDGPAGVAFSRAGLLRSGDVGADRLAAYALLDIRDDVLQRIVEKPDAATMSASADAPVSMNCWRLDSKIFRACRDVQPSSRGEFELPNAIQYAVEVLGERFEMIAADAPVLDLSRRADVAKVTARLQNVAVRL
jgi:glucose-1-phosphate thymidylyltransferase